MGWRSPGNGGGTKWSTAGRGGTGLRLRWMRLWSLARMMRSRYGGPLRQRRYIVDVVWERLLLMMRRLLLLVVVVLIVRMVQQMVGRYVAILHSRATCNTAGHHAATAAEAVWAGRGRTAAKMVVVVE